MAHARTSAARRGLTLLEVMATAAITASLMASSMVVLRSNYAAWQAHEADTERSAAANATLRHVVQALRQAASVTAITGSGDAAGSITIEREDGSLATWALVGSQATLQIDGGAATPLADDISGIEFVGYAADPQTETTNGPDIRSIHCAITTDRPAGGDRTISSHVWLRSW